MLFESTDINIKHFFDSITKYSWRDIYRENVFLFTTFTFTIYIEWIW